MRSISSIYFTKVNFSLLELFHSIGRIEILTDIMYNKLADVDITFPRIKDKMDKMTIFELPSNEQIQEEINKAKKQAINDARNLDMNVDNTGEIRCEYVYNNKSEQKDVPDEDLDLIDDTELLMESFENLEISYIRSPLEKPSSFLDILEKNGSLKKVRKSSVVSLLSTGKAKLSSDRLRRVQNSSEKSSRKYLSFLNEKTKEVIHQSDNLCIGDWCVFKVSKKMRKHGNFLDYVLVGAVVGFRLITAGKARWQKRFNCDYADVNSKDVEVLSTWHTFNANGTRYQK